MRVFIFGIGGTGSRVLRSLAMLLASGVKFNDPTVEVVPVIIDMDAFNGDTARTREVFRNYYTVRKTFLSATAPSNADNFFNTKIRSFNHLDTDSSDLDLQFDFQNRNGSFADFVNFNGLSKLNKDVLELMYNDSADTAEFPELYLNLNVGFKGNPNIGSVVFNDLKSSQQFKNLEAGYTESDRIFIISSIFGGTGSSGFPTLVKLIRNSSNPNLKKTRLGAITVMPYFNVDSKDESAINSSLFNTKTKAALSYYADDKDIKSVNALYYIADSNQSGTLPNVEGGQEQVNNSHLVELISAIAIADFIDKPDNDLEPEYKEEMKDGKLGKWTEGRCYSFGAESDAKPFTIHNFDPETKDKWIKPLVKFAYAAQIATRFIPQLTNNTFYGPKELNIGSGMGMPNEYNKMIAFFDAFKIWSAAEMNNESNGRIFNSFSYTDEEHVNNLVHGKSIKSGWFDKGLSKVKIAQYLNQYLSKEPQDKPIPQKYMSILYQTANECLTALGQLP